MKQFESAIYMAEYKDIIDMNNCEKFDSLVLDINKNNNKTFYISYKNKVSWCT
jgi:hypothetical protein